jgi:hypothetical protein
MLSDMLEGREKISNELQKIIDIRTEPWGINVISAEVKDVLIPAALEDAMSMQSQAERERQARVILGDSEKQVAEKFAEAARTYVNDPVALHLRAMNMLYEGLKQNSTIVIVPSSAVETMQLGGLAGLTALTMGLGSRPCSPREGTHAAWLVVWTRCCESRRCTLAHPSRDAIWRGISLGQSEGRIACFRETGTL